MDLSEPEAEFRGFVALGTAMLNINKATLQKNATYITELRQKLQSICSISTNDSILLRNINCAQQLNTLLV